MNPGVTDLHENVLLAIPEGLSNLSPDHEFCRILKRMRCLNELVRRANLGTRLLDTHIMRLEIFSTLWGNATGEITFSRKPDPWVIVSRERVCDNPRFEKATYTIKKVWKQLHFIRIVDGLQDTRIWSENWAPISISSEIHENLIQLDGMIDQMIGGLLVKIEQSTDWGATKIQTETLKKLGNALYGDPSRLLRE